MSLSTASDAARPASFDRGGGPVPGTDALCSLLDDPAVKATAFDDIANAEPQLGPVATMLGALARIVDDVSDDVDALLTAVADRPDRAATDVALQLPVTTQTYVARVALASAAGRDSEVLALTHGTDDIDDVTALLLVYRATALARLGLAVAARQTVARVLRSRRHHPAIRAFARQQRATAWAEEPTA
jgi:hypothetical protein